MISQNVPQTESNIYKNPIVISIFALCIVFVALNVVTYGHDYPLTTLVNTYIIPPLALVTTILAVFLQRQASHSPRARKLWTGLVLGWACWTVAEIIWASAFIFGQEPPYPSWADLFWCIGFFPMYMALWLRGHASIGKTSPLNRSISIMISLIVIGFTIFFLLIPIIQAYDPSDFWMSVLNIFYPLADLILILLALRFLFTASKGIFAHSWLWISLGFIVSSFSDLFYNYASWFEMYYPDGKDNIFSIYLVDIPYILSYLFFIAGLVPLLAKRQKPSPSNPIQGRTTPGNLNG
jgi:hypothetical protein